MEGLGSHTPATASPAQGPLLDAAKQTNKQNNEGNQSPEGKEGRDGEEAALREYRFLSRIF